MRRKFLPLKRWPNIFQWPVSIAISRIADNFDNSAQLGAKHSAEHNFRSSFRTHSLYLPPMRSTFIRLLIRQLIRQLIRLLIRLLIMLLSMLLIRLLIKLIWLLIWLITLQVYAKYLKLSDFIAYWILSAADKIWPLMTGRIVGYYRLPINFDL